MHKILIVDDKPAIVDLIKINLELEGFETVSCHSGKEALKLAQSANPDLILLDIMMPDMDGFEVCKAIQDLNIPIIMLTAKNDIKDKLYGLELGADDYITKPFSPRELVLRVKNTLRRGQDPEIKTDQISLGDLRIDIPRHQVLVQGKPVDLTATEFKLLTLLARRRGRVQTRERLLQDVWEYDNLIDTRTVDTHMRRLREKLGGAAKYLDTVRGVGYRFLDE